MTMPPIPPERAAKHALEYARTRPLVAAVRETVAEHEQGCSCALCAALHGYDHPAEPQLARGGFIAGGAGGAA